jgi:predicted AAA+ superfamily ATPase
MTDSTTASLLTALNETLQSLLMRMPAARWQGEGLDASLAVWHAMPRGLAAVPANSLEQAASIALLDPQGHYPVLRNNLLGFAAGKPANHALLWGARGTGKSSMVRAACAEMLEAYPDTVSVIEVLQEGLGYLPDLLEVILRSPERRFVLLLDDLAYEDGASVQGYNALKSLLEGSLLVRQGQILVVATSNRRHLVSELAIEQDSARALHSREIIEEKVSLSDRFGLWLGFPSSSQDDYLAMVKLHAKAAGLTYSDAMQADALEWAMTRGGRSGRVAAQFVRAHTA